MRFVPRLWLCVLMLAMLLPAAQPAAAQTTSVGFRYFPETGHNVGLRMLQFYDANGGLDIFGLPLTEVLVDETGLAVQYFERARFEIHPDKIGNYRVQLSLAGTITSGGREDGPFAWLSASPDSQRSFFPESGHTLGGAFSWFWQARGGLSVFGFPISEEFFETNPIDGQSHLVQYFQRARFEYHPDKQGTPYEVQLGLLGQQLLERSPLAQAATARAPRVTLLGSATTGFAASAEEREHNIARAVAMLDGLVVQPNTEFSFNAVGDFTEANGFVEGYAIVGDQLERVVGGGLCQVSTTLFRAVSNSGLRVTQRFGHSHIIYFYENTLGFDATVFDPVVDFRWFNNSAGAVYIDATSNPAAATVTMNMWGYSDGRKVSYEGPFTENWKQPGIPVWQLDKQLPAGTVKQLVKGRAGVDVRYVRIIKNSAGQVIGRNEYLTKYQPWEDFFAYGPEVTPPPGVKVVPPREKPKNGG